MERKLSLLGADFGIWVGERFNKIVFQYAVAFGRAYHIDTVNFIYIS